MRHARTIVTVTVSIAAVLMLAACGGRTLEAAAASSQSFQTPAVQDTHSTGAKEITGQVATGSRPCMLWFDGTSSLEGSIRLAAIDQIVTHLPRIADRENLGACEAYEWADKPWAATPFYKFTLPRHVEPAGEAVVCPEPPESEASKLFKPSRKRAEDAAAQRCKELHAAEDGRYQAAAQRNKAAFEHAMADTVAKLKAVLLARPPLEASCTSVTDHLTRIGRTRGPLTAISVTDGIETCRSALVPVEPPLEDVRLIVVLVDPKKPTAPTLAEDFDQRQQELLRVAPWIPVIVPFWRFDGAVGEKPSAAAATAREAKRRQ